MSSVWFGNHLYPDYITSWAREILLSTRLKITKRICPNNTYLVLEQCQGLLQYPLSVEFCLNNNIRLLVVLSEHMTKTRDQYKLNCFSSPEHSISSLFDERLHLLRYYDQVVEHYFTLGDFPWHSTWAEYLNRSLQDFTRIPINASTILVDKPMPTHASRYIFTGTITNYRAQVLSHLIAQGLDIDVLPITNPILSPWQRDKHYYNSDAVLDIPQDSSWPFSSTIRILDSLRQGSHAVVFAQHVSSEIEHLIIKASEIDLFNN